MLLLEVDLDDLDVLYDLVELDELDELEDPLYEPEFPLYVPPQLELLSVSGVGQFLITAPIILMIVTPRDGEESSSYS